MNENIHMDNTITGSVNVTRQDGTIYSLKTFVLRKMKNITETANRSKYYIYHGSYELNYLNQRIRRMSWFK